MSFNPINPYLEVQEASILEEKLFLLILKNCRFMYQMYLMEVVGITWFIYYFLLFLLKYKTSERDVESRNGH